MDRKKLIEGLRYCGSRDFCDDCPIYDECREPDFDICLKAADVIEELTKEKKSMIFSRSKAPKRVEHRRPCEVDGSKAWYHGLVHCDRTVVRMDGIFSSDKYAELERALQYKQVFPGNCQMHVERRTYAMVEYLDGSVAKVDPEQVHFIDV